MDRFLLGCACHSGRVAGINLQNELRGHSADADQTAEKQFQRVDQKMQRGLFLQGQNSKVPTSEQKPVGALHFRVSFNPGVG